MPSPSRRPLSRPDAPPHALFWILAIVFLDMTGMGLLVPVIPLIVQEFRADALTIGWLMAAYYAAQFIANPLLGAWSDRHGRKGVLLLSFLGSAAAYLAFGWAPALWVLFAGRLLDGFTGANVGTSQAYIADITDAGDRSRALALAGVALGAGFIVGPLIGVVLSGYGPHVPAFVAAGLALGGTLLAWWRLPESLPAPPVPILPAERQLNSFAPLRKALGRGSLRPLLIATFLANFAMAALRSHFAFFAFATLAFSQRDTSKVIAFLGVMMVVAQGGLVRQAVRRWGDHGTLVIGLVISAVGFAGLSVSSTPAMLYIMVAITAIGVGLGTPTMAALVSDRSGAIEQGVMLGAAQAAASLAQIVGPLWAGFVFDHAGPAFPFSSGAALVAAALLVVVLSRSDKRTSGVVSG
ncbi:MAG TPA: MFS transporter [Vicinamibacterales bacterium]|nr:MFS transporter [Vicinamibacterales bacterium]